MRHLQDEQLLLYIDGELKSRESGTVRSHLETCWQCRVELQEVQATVSECVRYRKNVLQCHLPPPPAPWNDIYQRFNEIDASMEPAFFQRLVGLLQWPAQNVARWAPIAVALLILGAIVYRYRETPSVHAAELLKKAIFAADARPAKLHAIQIRTRNHSIQRRSANERNPELSSLQAMFVAAKYDWEDPLSAKSFQAWRDGLPYKKDQVVEDANSYRIETDTSASELVSASLTLDSRDLRPVKERLEFRNSDWVEITELSEETTLPATAAAPAIRASEPVASSLPADTHVEEASAGDELHTLAALHGIGADLGDPIEVSLSGGKVLVSGAGIAPARRQQIEDILGANPKVVVRFAESAPLKAAPKRLPAENSANADLQQLQSRIAAQVGGRASFEQLASEVFDLSEPMMTRAYALRRLSEQFPSDSESQLSPQDQQLLRRLRQDHATALEREVNSIEKLLKPALGAASAANTGVPTVEDLFQSARRVDKLISVMFGSATGEANVDLLPAQLMSSVAQLHARAEAFNRTEK